MMYGDESQLDQPLHAIQHQFALFDMWVCEVAGDDTLIWDEDFVPVWFLHFIRPPLTTVESLTTSFPFLETFLPDARNHWSGTGKGLLHSGPFAIAEGPKREDELLLQATATRLGRRRMLYVGPYTPSTGEHRVIMQKSRELMLAHEALQRSRTELRQSETRMRRILKVLPDQVFVLNTSGKVLTHAGGPEHSDLIGLDIDTLLPELGSIRYKLEQCLEQDSVVHLEFERRVGKTFHSYEARIAPMTPEQAVMVVRDCTRAKTIESVKNEFLSIACHELRSPITGIIGVLEAAIEDGPGEMSWSWLEMGLDSAKSSLSLINRLLDLKRIESGAQEFNRRRVAACKLVQDGYLHCRGVALKLKRGIEKGACNEDLIVLADPDAVRQVMINLATNALKFSPEDKPVILDVNEYEGFARFSVRDKGPGIREKDRQRIFEKFAQVQDEHHREKGTGLGLSIARAIVQGHQGRIGLDSNPEQEPGSVFWFDLPLIQKNP